MKKIFALSIVLLFLFAACDPAISGTGPAVGSVDTYIEEEQEVLSTTGGTEDFNVNTAAFLALGPLQDGSEQEITLAFTHYVDEETIVANIQLIPLIDGADANSPYGEGSALSYSYDLVPQAGGAWNIEMSFDLSSYTEDSILLQINSGLTAENGTLLFSVDGDSELAETDDDSIFTYIAVNDDGNLPVPTALIGYENEPVDSAITFGVLGAPQTDLDLDGGGIDLAFAATGDSGSVFTANSLDNSFVFFRLNPVDGSWSDDTDNWTSAYDDTYGTDAQGLITFRRTSAVEGDRFRYTYNRSMVGESAEYRGFIHRVTNDDDVADTSSVINIADSSAVTAKYKETTITVDNGDVDNQYVDLTFNSGTLIDSSEITSNAVQFFVNNAPVDFETVYTTADNAFRIQFAPGTLSTGDSVDCTVRPVIADKNVEDDSTDDQTLYRSANYDLAMRDSYTMP